MLHQKHCKKDDQYDLGNLSRLKLKSADVQPAGCAQVFLPKTGLQNNQKYQVKHIKDP